MRRYGSLIKINPSAWHYLEFTLLAQKTYLSRKSFNHIFPSPYFYILLVYFKWKTKLSNLVEHFLQPSSQKTRIFFLTTEAATKFFLQSKSLLLLFFIPENPHSREVDVNKRTVTTHFYSLSQGIRFGHNMISYAYFYWPHLGLN